MLAEDSSFLGELKNLLEQYDASIAFDVGEGSDTYGLYDEAIVVMVGDREIYRVDGYGIDSTDIE